MGWRTARPAGTLVRRITVLVIGVGLLSFGIQAVVLALWTRPIADQLFAAMADQAMATQRALQATPAGQREALARAFSGGDRLLMQRPLVRAPLQSAAARFGPPDLVPGLRGRLSQGVEVLPLARAGADGPPALSFRLPVDGEVWWLQFQGAPPALAIRDTLLLWLALLAAITALGSAFGVRWVARPLARLATQIAAQRGSLQPLPAHPDAPAELRTVVQAFNTLAQAVDAAQSTRQHLLAGVSHDLRTPLARLRLRVETQCEGDTAEALTADLQALQRIVDQFLAYVHGEEGARPGTDQPLADTVRAVVAQYRAQGRPVEMDIAAVPRTAPDLAVARIVGNLVDNALAHGQAPVTVVLRQHGDRAQLTVFDAGPGLDPAQFAQAQQPFVRLQRTGGELGHCGLGLAIVSRLAQQLDATLTAQQVGAGARRFGVSLTWGRPGDRPPQCP